jgi:hypothetical protein
MLCHEESPEKVWKDERRSGSRSPPGSAAPIRTDGAADKYDLPFVARHRGPPIDQRVSAAMALAVQNASRPVSHSARDLSLFVEFRRLDQTP